MIHRSGLLTTLAAGVILAAVASPSPALAVPTFQVSGVVTDADGNPVDSALVLVSGLFNQVRVGTGSDGSYSASVPQNANVGVKVVWPLGFVNSDEVNIDVTGPVVLDFQLVPDDLALVPTIVGTSGDDVLVGTPGDDIIFGGAGNDVIRGRGGDDIIFGGPGDDQLRGGRGADRLYDYSGDNIVRGGRGRDVITVVAGDDTIVGGRGADIIRSSLGDDTIAGGRGNDSIREISGPPLVSQSITGGNGDDEIFVDDGVSIVLGGAGNDTLQVGSGNPNDGDPVPVSLLDCGDGDADVGNWFSSPSDGDFLNCETVAGLF